MSETVATTPQKTNPLTKLEAVRQAMAKLGKDAGRIELQSYVKQHFGFDMTPDHISNYKNKLQGKKGKGKAKKPAAAKPQATAMKTAPAAPKPAAASPHLPTGISLDDIESVKGLVGRVGPAQLRSLVDLLAK